MLTSTARNSVSLRSAAALMRAPLVRTQTLRSYSNRPSEEERKKDKTVNLRNFVTVGIFASIILTQVVDAVNQEKPLPRSMSETEYYQQQARLKRKVLMFSPDDKEVYFVKSGTRIEKNQIPLTGAIVIQPSDLVEAEKKDEHSKYFALLNDPSTVDLPRGLVVDLIGKFIATQPNGKFIVLNFPADIKESSKFEDKIVTIKNLINVSDADADKGVDDVVKYYKTVDKVKQVTSVEDIKDGLF